MDMTNNDIRHKCDNGKLVIIFENRLDLDTVSDLWQKAISLQKKHKPNLLSLDVCKVSYCDGSGVALFLKLKQYQLDLKQNFEFIGISPWLQNLIAVTEKSHIEPETPATHFNFAITLGKYTVKTLENFAENIIFIGKLTTQLVQTIFNFKHIRWLDFWRSLEDVGPSALPIITLIGFLVGLITTFQSAPALGRFGAQIYIVNLVGLGLIREMGPLMSAILLAGRTASSFAAELGTMKINQEIDAITTMGLEPIRFLVIPRILATTLMAPFLNIFFIFFGLVGCALIMQTLGFNLSIFLHQLYSAVTLTDFITGMIKTFAFGIVISGVGCLHGLKTHIGATAVGYSTTQAVVSAIILIVIVDGVFANIFYVLGI